MIKDKTQIIFELMTIVHNFKRLSRTGWNRAAQGDYSQNQVRDAESVADHSYGLIMLCLFIGEILQLNVKKMLIMALFHDLPEAVTGDQITALERNKEKRFWLESVKEEKEKLIFWEMFYFLDEATRRKYFAYFVEYLECESEEAQIVYQLDKVETILQAYFYSLEGEMVSPLEFIESYKEKIDKPFLKELVSLIKIKATGGQNESG
jgi:putative hydrolase of HD superfamily